MFVLQQVYYADALMDAERDHDLGFEQISGSGGRSQGLVLRAVTNS